MTKLFHNARGDHEPHITTQASMLNSRSFYQLGRHYYRDQRMCGESEWASRV